VPIKYSAVSALLLPFFTDRIICGSQKREYMLATNTSAREGVTMTRTMNVRKKNIPSPEGMSEGSGYGNT
jgi:hypothetical protein